MLKNTKIPLAKKRMPPFRTRRNSVQIVKQQLPPRMITRSRSKIVHINETPNPVKRSIPKKTTRRSVKKLVARPRTVPMKKSVARPRTAPSVSRARQPKKQSKIEKGSNMELVTKCKNLQLKVADLRKENLSLKKQLSVFEEWRKSETLLKLQNAVLRSNPGPVKEIDLLQMIESGMDYDQIKTELTKFGFSPSHNIWNEFDYLKHFVIACSSEINDVETSGTARPGDKDKGKCSKKLQEKNVLQEEYDKIKIKLDEILTRHKQESDYNLQVKRGMVTTIEEKISRLQKSEVDDLKVIHELEEIISAKKEKCGELESKYQDIKRQTLLLGTEYSGKKLEHNAFKTNAEQCERCKKLKEDLKAVNLEWKGNCTRRKEALTELKEVHKQCAASCRQGGMLKAELEYLKVKIDCTKQLYYGCPYVAESGELLRKEREVRLKREKKYIEREYRRCLALCNVSSAPLSSSSSSLSSSSSDEELMGVEGPSGPR